MGSESGTTEPEASEEQRASEPGEWRIWPPSPKMQIVLIAAVFGLFNFCLLAIWAYVMIDQFG